jgi:UDP-N-acetylmuramate--alanine ligase
VTYLGGDRARLLDHLCDITRPGDLVLTLGAGDVGELGPALLARLDADPVDGRNAC